MTRFIVHDELLSGQFGAGRKAIACPRMFRGDEEDEFILEKRRELEAFVRGEFHGEGEVDEAILEKADSAVGVSAFDADVAAWEVLAKLADDLGQEAGAEARWGSESKPCASPFAQGLDAFAGGGHFLKDSFGVLQKMLTGLCKDQLFAHPVKKPTPNILFESAHGMADGALGEEEFACCLRETSIVCESHEGLELSAVEWRLHG